MTSKNANPVKPNIAARAVLFVVYQNVKLLDLAGPLQVFSDAIDERGQKIYDTAVISIDGGPVNTDTPVSIETEAAKLWIDRDIDTLVIAGGHGARSAAQDKKITDQVKLLSKNASRIASVCTGAFILAACGLLDKRRAVTHWQSCDELSKTFPSVSVETDPIYIKDDNIWTSAGVTAGIDMALAIVSEDLGRKASLSLARELVAYVVRPGGQSQFSAALDRQTADQSGQFDKLHHWMNDNLRENLQVESLAEWSNMSSRNFSRAYTKQTGQTPAKAVETMRTEAARRLLEVSDLSVKQVADKCGFGDDERMRRSFMRLLNVAPSDYRQRFTQIEK